MGFFRKKKKVEEEVIPPVQTRLYVLVEVQKQGLVQYLHENGVEVYALTDNPDELMDEFLLEDTDCRLVIIDNGRGRFEDKHMKESLLSLIEIVADMGKVTIFCTAGFLLHTKKNMTAKSKEVGSRIDIFKTSGAVDILSNLKTYNEVYTEGGAKDVTVEGVLNFKGEHIDLKTNDIDVSALAVPVDLDMDNDDISLPRFGKAKRRV